MRYDLYYFRTQMWIQGSSKQLAIQKEETEHAPKEEKQQLSRTPNPNPSQGQLPLRKVHKSIN